MYGRMLSPQCQQKSSGTYEFAPHRGQVFTCCAGGLSSGRDVGPEYPYLFDGLFLLIWIATAAMQPKMLKKKPRKKKSMGL